MTPVLGIDLGTSRMAAALAVGGHVVAVPHVGGGSSIPAMVGFPAAPGVPATGAGGVGVAAGGATGGVSLGGDRPLVGYTAEPLRARRPERLVTAVKRLFGRKLESPEVRRHRQDVVYEVVAARNGDARVRVGRRHHAPPELAAYLIEELKRAAEAVAGVPITEAVVAMPSCFHDLQRQAMRDAARIAGLEVRGVISEPAAAAFGAGLLAVEGRDERRVLVYDLGGGSFSVAALRATEDEVAVVASGGDAFLGGEDFDQRVLTYVCDEVQRACGIDLRKSRPLLAQLKVAAEAAKRALSTVESVDVPVGDLVGGLIRRSRAAGAAAAAGGGAAAARMRDKTPPPSAGVAALRAALPATIPLSRARLVSLTQDLIDRTVWPCEGVLRDAGWTAEDLDVVLLVGGQTQMPALRAQIRELLGGREPVETADPEALVALGAARQGAVLTGQVRGGVAVGDVMSLPLGVEAAGGVSARLIPKGTALPATRSQVVSTAVDGQTQIVVHLLQGEREMAADNESLSRVVLGPLPPRPRGVPQFTVTIESDGGGLPRVSARDLGSGDPRPVRVRPSGGLTDSEVAVLAAAHAGRPLPAAVAVADREGAAPDASEHDGAGTGAPGSEDYLVDPAL